MQLSLPEWVKYANCGGCPMEWFFPGDDVGEDWYSSEAATNAIRICQRCDVQEECFEWSLTNENTIEHGVFAGTNPAQRRRYLSVRGGPVPSGSEG